MQLSELTAYLDGYLRIAEVGDHPHALNGLQVENGGQVNHIGLAVDACQASIDQAVSRRADLLLVHHGLFWGGLEPVTNRHGRRIRTLVQHNLALYAAHVPLDVHPEVGNNAVLARLLGVRDVEWFGEYRGEAIGTVGTVDLTRSELVTQVSQLLSVTPHVIAAGPDRVTRLGIVTGGGGNLIRQAVDVGADTYLTGEGAHHTHFDAEEWGVNVIYAGHYATETLGVKALGEHLTREFGLPCVFIDHPTGL